MDPQYLTLFNAIHKLNANHIKKFLANHSQGPWLVNSENMTALDYVLQEDNTECINVMLEKIAQEAKSGAHAVEAGWAFDYALVKAVKHFCSKLDSWEDYAWFYKHPAEKFTLLKEDDKGYYTYFRDIALQNGAASSAYNEAVNIKPKIQRFIRTQAVADGLTTALRMYRNADSTFFQSLRGTFTEWSKKPLFIDHTNYGMGLLPTRPTKTHQMFIDLLAAIAILDENKGVLPVTLSLDQAKKIMLLCTKCFPFSLQDYGTSSPNAQETLRKYWVKIAAQILDIFKLDPEAIKTLFECILDKQWLFTSENIPLTQSHLLAALPVEKIIQGLRAHNQDVIAEALEKKTPFLLKPGEGMDIIALYPLPAGKKHFVIAGPPDADTLKYLHLVLMNNQTLSFSLTLNDIFENNPLKYFPQVPCRIFIDVINPTQMAHLNSHIMTHCRVHPHMGFIVPIKLLTEQKFTELHAIADHLGPNQTITAQVTDSLESRLVLADMIISKHNLVLGPNMIAKTAVQPSSFCLLHDKFSWIIGFAATDLTAQLQTVSLALNAGKPLFFIFSHLNFDPAVFAGIQELLKKNTNADLSCYIRVDNISSATTHCDFVVTRQAIKPGPLFMAALCTEPSLYASATSVKVVRKAEPVKEKEKEKEEIVQSNNNTII